MTHSASRSEGLAKTLTWRDGFAIALVIPNGLLLTVGYAIGAIGGWTAIAIWVVGAVIGFMQNQLFAEMAAMLPNISGGVSRYAAEAWKRYFAPVGAIASFGYWIGWSFSIAVNAAAIGTLVQTQWFSHATGGVPILGHHVGLMEAIAILAIIGGWASNYFGARLSAKANKVMALVVLAGLLVIMIVPLVKDGGWHLHRLTWEHGGSWMTLVVWFYVTAWTTYGTEICASFAPEYKDTVRDTSKALRMTSLVSIALFIIAPMALTGPVGEQAIAQNPVSVFALAFEHALGGFSSLGVLILIASMFLGMVSTTADGARALYGLAREGMTLRQLDKVNRWGVPGRALTLDAIVNSLIVLLLGQPLSILLASNLGYIVAISLAVAAFLLFRKDRPDLERPIKRSPIWIPIAWALLIFDLFVLTIGVTHPGLAGYGGAKQTLVGLGILLLAVLLFIYRQVIQERAPLRWRVRDEDADIPGPRPEQELV